MRVDKIVFVKDLLVSHFRKGQDAFNLLMK